MNSKSTRVAGIVTKDNKILLIHRQKNGKKYYVFPGGSVEKNEVNEEALIREIKEETSIKVEIKRLVYVHDYQTSQQYYYLSEYHGGRPRLASGSIEKQRMKTKNDFYQPLWVDISSLSKLLLYPLEIRDWLISDLKNGFPSKPRKAKLKISDLRQDLIE